ncbi:MAG TPA: helix-turn-helix domain-containing protein [Pseudonocardia sp.]|nr:helix-turn-helix domain-containing protein [Pseudonocardia sp.]
MTTWTAAQQREAARSAYNAELADCPGHQVLAILSGKWATLVVEALVDGPHRHAELAARVAGATQKMLTQTLRALERDGLVDRTVIAGVPPRVDYRLTALGEEFFALQRQVRDWADRHAGAIAAARGEHDRAGGRVSES